MNHRLVCWASQQRPGQGSVLLILLPWTDHRKETTGDASINKYNSILDISIIQRINIGISQSALERYL